MSKCRCGAEHIEIIPGQGKKCSRGHVTAFSESPNGRATAVATLNGHTSPPSPTAVTRAITRRLADVEPESVAWLWPGRIPLGKLTMLDGDPGLGKSFLTVDLAARVSTGRAMPDGVRGDLTDVAGVVILACEDDPADTMRPRLDAAGGDPARILLLEGVREIRADNRGEQTERERSVILTDVGALREAIHQVGAKLVIVDPIMAYMAGADTHVDAEVRTVLGGLASLAREERVAIVAIRHLNKAGGVNALYRGGGSIAFIAAARSGLLAAKDPENPKRRILVSTKNNLAETPETLAYSIESNDGRGPCVVWHGTIAYTAEQVLAVPGDADERTMTEDAREWLASYLAEGEAKATDVQQAARKAGITDKPLRRAREALCEAPRRVGFGRDAYFVWKLKEQTGDQAMDAPSPIDAQDALLGHLGHLYENGHLWPGSSDACDDLSEAEFQRLVDDDIRRYGRYEPGRPYAKDTDS